MFASIASLFDSLDDEEFIIPVTTVVLGFFGGGCFVSCGVATGWGMRLSIQAVWTQLDVCNEGVGWLANLNGWEEEFPWQVYSS
jgi:hypothetical protein